MADRRVYLVAYLTTALNDYVDGHDALMAVRAHTLPVATRRRHLTVLNLAIVDMPEALLVAALRLVMTAMPPDAFRMVLDRCVIDAESALIAASERVAGFRRCQHDLLAGLRRYTIDLPPRDAMVGPHVTLGYGDAALRGVRGIDGISWMVDELSLIVSHHGETRHELIERWQLPVAPAMP